VPLGYGVSELEVLDCASRRGTDAADDVHRCALWKRDTRATAWPV